MDLIITILPVVTKDLPISPRFTPYNFLSRCKFSTLTTRQPMVEFYSLTFPRFPLRKKEHKPTLVRIELTTSALASVQSRRAGGLRFAAIPLAFRRVKKKIYVMYHL